MFIDYKMKTNCSTYYSSYVYLILPAIYTYAFCKWACPFEHHTLIWYLWIISMYYVNSDRHVKTQNQMWCSKGQAQYLTKIFKKSAHDYRYFSYYIINRKWRNTSKSSQITRNPDLWYIFILTLIVSNQFKLLKSVTHDITTY